MRGALALTLVSMLVAVATACGGGEENVSSEPLREGVYGFELTEEYLLQNGISTSQAAAESGTHEITLDGGSFVDRWRTAEGRTGGCTGTYEDDDGRVTFRWVSGCFGDWRMAYAVVGDTVTWSDIEALPPYDSDEDQNVNEVFNGVPWTRTGDVPEEGDE